MSRRIKPPAYRTVHKPGPHPHELQAQKWAEQWRLPPLEGEDDAQRLWGEAARCESVRQFKRFIEGKSPDYVIQAKKILADHITRRTDASFWIEMRGCWRESWRRIIAQHYHDGRADAQ